MVEFINPDKSFHFDGKDAILETGTRNSIDFWKWGYSDLVQNINRGILAEYIVAWALNLDNEPRKPWDAFDLKTDDGKRIEVKSTSYLQSWDYGTKPYPKFVIKQRQRWTESGLEKDGDFNADVYILCYHKEQGRENLDPMNLNQWDFWIFSKDKIINLLNGRKSISVSQLRNEGYKPIPIGNIKNKINEK